MTRVQPRLHKFTTLSKGESHTSLLRIALRRRKIGLQALNGRYKVLRSKTSTVGGLDGAVISLPSDLAVRIASSKWETKQAFSAAGIRYPEARRFLESELDAAKAYMSGLGGVFVVKAERGRASVGISLGVRTECELADAWSRAVESSLDRAPDRGVVVERFHVGLDVRVYVVGESAVSAVVRVPAYVVGDGRTRLSELYAAAVKPRSRHAHLTEHTPRLADLPIGQWDLGEDSVLAAGVFQPLSENTSIRGGAVSVDVTEELNHDIKTLAIDAAWAVPGLKAGGVDLLVPSLDRVDDAVVLEVNVAANILPHTYPALGKSRDVAGALVDLLIRTSRAR